MLAESVNASVTEVLAGVAVRAVGADGTVRGVTLAAADSRLLAKALLALTVQLTATPLVRPETTIGEPAPFASEEPQIAR